VDRFAAVLVEGALAVLLMHVLGTLASLLVQYAADALVRRLRARARAARGAAVPDGAPTRAELAEALRDVVFARPETEAAPAGPERTLRAIHHGQDVLRRYVAHEP
jgi:hypothetical protein